LLVIFPQASKLLHFVSRLGEVAPKTLTNSILWEKVRKLLSMVAVKIAVISALVLVVVKFVASILGKGNIPLLNQAVTVILTMFIAFELIQLGQAVIEKIN
jgi:hypothetical protein